MCMRRDGPVTCIDVRGELGRARTMGGRPGPDAFPVPSQAVVACTCLGSSSLRRQQFDACVVDEASQAPQPSCLGPLFLAERFLLAGDPKQLPPVVQSPKARCVPRFGQAFVHSPVRQRFRRAVRGWVKREQLRHGFSNWAPWNPGDS